MLKCEIDTFWKIENFSHSFPALLGRTIVDHFVDHIEPEDDWHHDLYDLVKMRSLIKGIVFIIDKLHVDNRIVVVFAKYRTKKSG